MSQKKILVIEDSAELADSLEDMLNFKGYQAIKAVAGVQGLTMALVEKPDLILLDLKLPDIDGFEVIRQLRKDEWGAKVHILMLTASDTTGALPADINLTQEDILHKSHWGIDNIAKRIEDKLAGITTAQAE